MHEGMENAEHIVGGQETPPNMQGSPPLTSGQRHKLLWEPDEETRLSGRAILMLLSLYSKILLMLVLWKCCFFPLTGLTESTPLTSCHFRILSCSGRPKDIFP